MKLIKHNTFHDIRGSYTPISLDTLDIKWSQCSISVNENKFTFRGMHYQESPPQTKYIKVIRGKIIDFAYDLKTGELDWATLTDQDAVLIADTKAHGFLTLQDNTIVSYLVEGVWNPKTEKSIPWFQITELKEIVSNIIVESKLVISEKDKYGK